MARPLRERFSLNQRSLAQWTLPEAVEGCLHAGVESIGVWREPLHEYGLQQSVRLLRESGLRVSSLCRGGFFTDPDPVRHRIAIEDNRQAIDEAAALGADCLVLVVGRIPPGSKDLAGARDSVRDSLEQLVPYALERGVRLGLEPMHPIFCSDRGVLSTLDQALDLAAPYPTAAVGVVVDAYHVWWDPRLDATLERAGDRICSFQINDWVVPLPADNLLGRGLPGDGCIDLRDLHEKVGDAGYGGDIEVEIFNAELWARPAAEALDDLVQRYSDVLEPPSAES